MTEQTRPQSEDQMSDIERYELALKNRAEGKATLGDAVAIARGRPGPPAAPVSFDGPDLDGHDPDLDEDGICRVCGKFEPE